MNCQSSVETNGYITLETSEDVYKEKGDFPIKLKTKDEEKTFIEADDEFIEKKKEVDYHESIVEYLQEIVKQIGNRGFQIKMQLSGENSNAGM